MKLLLSLALLLVLTKCSEFPGRDFNGHEDDVSGFDERITDKTTLSTEMFLNASISCPEIVDLCKIDRNCDALLNIANRLCGVRVVGCSTTTTQKCVKAMNTVVIHSFFNPSCSCERLGGDSRCKMLRVFLYNHPCKHVKPIYDDLITDSNDINGTLLTCDQAFKYCKSMYECSTKYATFQKHCGQRDPVNKNCIPTYKPKCLEAHKKVTQMPIYGCLCESYEENSTCGEMNQVNQDQCELFQFSIYLGHANSTTDGDYIENVIAGRNYPNSNGNLPGIPGTSIPALPDKENISHYISSPWKYSLREDEDQTLIDFQSTCHHALEACENNSRCKHFLQPVIEHCQRNTCNPDICLKALRDFYRTKGMDWLIEDLAFCLCKQTNDQEQELCTRAQNYVHPACAVEFQTHHSCYTVGHACFDDILCKVSMENYTQACSYNHISNYCNAHLGDCRRAMIHTIGTTLRRHCHCKDNNDMSEECMDWYKILWHNPCVVEAQREFHINKIRKKLGKKPAELMLTNYVSPIPIPAEEIMNTFIPNNNRMKFHSSTIASTSTLTVTNTNATTKHKHSHTTPVTPFKATKIAFTTEYTTPIKRTTDRFESVTTALNSQATTKLYPPYYKSNKYTKVTYRPPYVRKPNLAEKITTMKTTITSLGTSVITRKTDVKKNTTLKLTKHRKPEKYSLNTYRFNNKEFSTAELEDGCVVEKYRYEEYYYMLTNTALRMYHENELDCTEVCTCDTPHYLMCNTMCISLYGCRTEIATYGHSAPAYISERGYCVCYAGDFVCTHPVEGSYRLLYGIFIFLGYSVKELGSISNYYAIDLENTVAKVQKYMELVNDYNVSCKLIWYNSYPENIILVAKHASFDMDGIDIMVHNATYNEIMKDTSACIQAVKKTTSLINKPDGRFIINADLSIFKQATYEVLDAPSSCGKLTFLKDLTLSVLVILLIPAI